MERLTQWIEKDRAIPRNEEYKEPEPDWSKVKVDTPILVSKDGVDWERQHFAGYIDRVVYSFYDGGTSWTSEGDEVKRNYAKLAEVPEYD